MDNDYFDSCEWLALDDVFDADCVVHVSSKSALEALLNKKTPGFISECADVYSQRRDKILDSRSILVNLSGSDFLDPTMCYDYLYKTLFLKKSHIKYNLFTVHSFTIEMPAPMEHALAAAEMLAAVKDAIRVQLFGLNHSSERLPIQIHFQQEGKVELPGPKPQPILEPDFQINLGRRSIPFLVGEVGVSDSLRYTKLKSSLWLEKGNGDVRFAIAIKMKVDAARNIQAARVLLYTLREPELPHRKPGPQSILRKARITQEIAISLVG